MPFRTDDPILNLLEKPIQNHLNTAVLVKVLPGDTVSQLVTKYYDTSLGTTTYQLALAQLRRHNPKVTNINHIRSGQVLKLMPLPVEPEIRKVELPANFDPWQIAVDTRPFNELQCGPDSNYDENHMMVHMPDDPAPMDVFYQVSWFEEHWFDLLQGGTGSVVTGLSTLTGTGNTALIHEVKQAYERYKAGQITKGQYDYVRRQSLSKLSNKLGKLENILFKGQTAQQAIRISRVKGVPATSHVIRHAERLGKISKVVGNGGGLVLAGAGLGMSCYNIGQTSNHHEQNEIVAEALGGLLGGGAASMIGLVLITGPVGITVALGVGLASAGASWGSGKLAKYLYNLFGKEVDLAGVTGVRGLCG